ncbi:MAG: hypothetical protein WCP16_08220 [Pseudanabaena sp. ELA645]
MAKKQSFSWINLANQGYCVTERSPFLLCKILILLPDTPLESHAHFEQFIHAASRSGDRE